MTEEQTAEAWVQEHMPVMPTQGNDPVLHPSHYTKGGVECIQAIEASMTPEAFRGYCKGNALKYIWRYEDKGGVESLQKARVYLNWLIRAENKEKL